MFISPGIANLEIQGRRCRADRQAIPRYDGEPEEYARQLGSCSWHGFNRVISPARAWPDASLRSNPSHQARLSPGRSKLLSRLSPYSEIGNLDNARSLSHT